MWLWQFGGHCRGQSSLQSSWRQRRCGEAIWPPNPLHHLTHQRARGPHSHPGHCLTAGGSPTTVFEGPWPFTPAARLVCIFLLARRADAHYLCGASKNPAREVFCYSQVTHKETQVQTALKEGCWVPRFQTEILRTLQGGRCYHEPILPEVETEARGVDRTASWHGRIWTGAGSVAEPVLWCPTPDCLGGAL